MSDYEPIAIIGVGCRFPGGVHGPDSFWQLLCDGVDAITEIPADRWNIETFYDPTPGRKGKSSARRGGFLDSIDQFDAGFFGVSPREAALMDPQQRLLLHASWEALEDGGVAIDTGSPSPVGVFVGVSTTDYSLLQSTINDFSTIDVYTATGGVASMAANRISYCLNLNGPSVAVDTACSSSLVAVHLACKSLWNGECPLALAGGVNVIIVPTPFITFSRGGMLSPDGRCKAFDAGANGFVRGEGVGVIALKPLHAAVADGNPIYAVIRATAVNQDGRTSGITLPSATAQEALVREACRSAGVPPAKIQYIEAHGTGTFVGDPIEAHALGTALGDDRGSDNPCWIGSVKTNLGHLEAGAGIAGIIKVALSLKNGRIPPSLHFQTPNPYIDFEKLKLRVAQGIEPYRNGEEPAMAGVNSFGFGGTNAHAVLQAMPDAGRRPRQRPDRTHLLTLSARSPESLRALAQKYQALLSSDSPLEDICYTAGTHRAHHPQRLCITASSPQGASEALGAFLNGESRPGMSSGQPVAEPSPVFVFSGQGPQWWAMGRQLLQEEPVFRQMILECDRLFRQLGSWSLIEELTRAEAESRLHETALAQPAIFSLQVALAALWQSWGIQPGAVVGHSVGEVAAAYCAGVLRLPEVARVIFERGRCMDLASERGRMLAAGLSGEQAEEAIRPYADRVSLAALNGPNSVTLSGDAEAVQAIAAALDQRGVFHRFLPVNYAFHSQQMEPVHDELRRSLGQVEVHPAALPLLSTVTGVAATADDFDAGYWWHNVRRPVRFATAIDTLLGHGHRIFLELSPHPVLAGNILECLAYRSFTGTVLPSLRRKEEERGTMLGSLGALHVLGCRVNWKALYPHAATVALPAYAWQSERYWNEAEEVRKVRLEPVAHPFLAQNLLTAEPAWQTRLDLEAFAYLKDHQVQGHIVFPASAYVEMALGAARVLFGSTPRVVEEMDFQQALFLREGQEPVRVQFDHRPPDAGFTISSSTGGAGSSWTVHSAGRIRACSDAAPPEATSFDRVRETCREEITAEMNYQFSREIGLPYGPAFRGVETIWRRDGEALGRVRMPASLQPEAGKYQFHPALLDACFQVLTYAQSLEDVLESGMIYLPVHIERLRFFSRPGAVVWSHARLVRRNGRSVTGDIRILDEEGRLLVEVTGFRWQAATQARTRAGDDVNDWLHEFRWKLLSPGRAAEAGGLPATPSQIIARTKRLAGRLERQPGFLPDLKRLTAEMDVLGRYYILAACEQMGWRPRKGEAVTLEDLEKRLGVVPRHRRVFARYLSFLETDGVLGRSGDGWRVRRAPKPVSTEALWRRILSRYPGALPELLLLRRCGRELAAVLQGSADPLQLIFPAGSLADTEHLYQDSRWFRACNLLVAEAVAAAVGGLSAERTIRVLEIGAGTGGMTARVLPVLPASRTEYVFSDLSSLFLSKAEQKFFENTFVRYQVLDIEKSPQEQGFEPHSFDIILASDALHATQDLRETLAHIRSLLAPQGLLVLLELVRSARLIDLVFGLTEGWWRFRDTGLRASYPLLDCEHWLELLRETGFAEAGAIPERSDQEVNWHSVFVARGPQLPARVEVPSPPEIPRREKPGVWLLFADRSGLAEEVASLLQARGDHPVTVSAGTNAAEIRDLRLLDIAGIVDFSSLDAPGCDSILHLVQAFSQDDAVELPRLWLVTRGCQAVQPCDPVAVAQAPVWGLGRVIMNEIPKFRCRMVDLCPNGSPGEAAALLRELEATDGEEEIAYRGTARFANRVGKTSLEQHLRPLKISRRDAGYRLETPAPGALDRLVLRARPRRQPGPGEIEIEVKAAALNFRDVMKALGVYPGEEANDTLLGDECAGCVTAVGPGVRHLRPGDEVMAIAPGCFSSHLTIPATLVARKPARLSFEEAAAIPVGFLTAWYALHHLGRLRRGERVLIQAASGGVGLAAIQIAQLAGAEVFATAGNPEKRDFLRALGVRYVMDSRSLAFAEEVRELTAGRGVDLVLNSLAGEAIAKGIGTLAPHGRFLEIGKRDIYQNSKLGLRPFRNNISLFAIDLGQVLRDDPAPAAAMLARLLSHIEAGRLHPLPWRSFPISQAAHAFRHMSQARHIGKIVLSMQNDRVTPVPAPDHKSIRLKANASYLITGGLGGFGLAVAEWMLQNGARHIVLASRSGASSEAARQARAALRKYGGEVLVTKTDAGSRRDVARMFRTVARRMPPLRGIVHAAMVIDDGPLAQQSGERFRRVMAPKADGAWHLHTAAAQLPLDFFVLFSSFTSVFGTPTQSSYVAANCFLDALAHYRRARGLPALAIQWGLITDVGYVARNVKVADSLRRLGFDGLSAAEATRVLGRLLQSGATEIGVVRMDWRKLSLVLPTIGASPRFAEVVPLSSPDQPEKTAFREALLALPPIERMPALIAQLKEQIAKVLRTSAAKLDVELPLSALGLDSLMAVELVTSIEEHCGIVLPVGKVTAGASIAKMAASLLEILTGAPPPATPAIGPRASSDCLVPLRSVGDRPPLFCIHPAGGLVNMYDPVAKLLPPDRPVYGIQSRAVCGDAGEHTCLASMAQHYAGLIAETQPRGPHCLLGFSIGGFVAMATAHALEARGRRVALVGLIDADGRLAGSADLENATLKQHIAGIHDTFAREQAILRPLDAESLDEVVSRLGSRIRGAPSEARAGVATQWLTEQGYIANGRPADLFTQYLSLFYAHGELVKHFEPQIIHVPLVIWRISQAGGTPDWRQYTTGPVTEYVIPGAHYNLLYPPLVDTLAAQLTAALG